MKGHGAILKCIENGYCYLPINHIHRVIYKPSYEWKVRYWSVYQWSIESGRDTKAGFAIDHIVPVSFGFENRIPWYVVGDIINLQSLTSKDNLRKSNVLQLNEVKTLLLLSEKFEFYMKSRGTRSKEEMFFDSIHPDKESMVANVNFALTIKTERIDRDMTRGRLGSMIGTDAAYIKAVEEGFVIPPMDLIEL